MQIVYRISPEKDTGKPRPGWFSKKECLASCVKVLGSKASLHFVAHGFGTPVQFDAFLTVLCPHEPAHLCPIQAANGAEAFLRALDYTLSLDASDDEIVYLVEDDYLHRPGAAEVIHEGMALDFHYLTLYDHPDKYLDGGPNPLVAFRAENTRLYLGPRCHFKLTNSTTMTFACRLGTLRKDAGVFYEMSKGEIVPPDFDIFRELCRLGATIGSAVPAYATHCEAQWLSPLIDWDEVASA
jgi:hypothetical protein